MRSRLLLLPLLALAACATPLERCERAATEDLRVLDALIVETQQNIDRGYAIDQEIRESPYLRLCYGRSVDDGRLGMVFCNDRRTIVRDRPVAIDLDAERAKLASLKAKRSEVAQRAAVALASCHAQFPDS